MLFNGTLYILTTGCTWHGVPENCGTNTPDTQFIILLL